MQLKDKEEAMIQGLFREIQEYYKKLVNSKELPGQDQVEDVSVCFRIMCQIVDSFLQGYQELQEQYKLLEDQLVKSEAENRNHIRIEQQLKMYAENLQEQNELFESQIKAQKKTMNSLQKELSVLKKQLRSNSQERLCTDSTQDRIQSIISQQLKNNTIPLKAKMVKKPKQDLMSTIVNNNRSHSHLGQYATIERMQEALQVMNTKKKKMSQSTKQRAATIHVTEQSTRLKSGKARSRANQSCHHYDD